MLNIAFAQRIRLRRWALPCLLICALGCRATNANVPFPTFGGKQFWADEFICDGWRIQKNIFTEHCRLLDAKDVRWAWGDFESCLEYYQDNVEVDEPQSDPKELVVLLHGHLRSKDSLAMLEAEFLKLGYRTMNVNYPSTQATIKTHAEQVNRILSRVANVSKVHFVTHSMGGLVLRHLLGSLEDQKWRSLTTIGNSCMIFPPNQGSSLADMLSEGGAIVPMLGGPATLEMTTKEIGKIPPLKTSLGVIAGGRGDGEGKNPLVEGDDDGTVAVEETRLEGMSDHLVLDLGHTFGMRDSALIKAAVRFVKNGRFSEDH